MVVNEGEARKNEHRATQHLTREVGCEGGSTVQFVLLEDASPTDPDSHSRLYCDPCAVLRLTLEPDAHTFSENEYIYWQQKLQCLLDEAEAYLARGWYAVLICHYELCGLLHHVPIHTTSEPLIELQFYQQYQSLNAQQVNDFLSSQNILPDHPAGVMNIQSSIDQAQFEHAFARLQDYLLHGHSYQINFSYRLFFDSYGSPITLYQDLRARQPVPFSALIRTQHGWVLSFSPELFVRRQGQTLSAKPMKGTAPRSGVADESEAVALELNEKERTENLIIVDLLRNDLGRISQTGSVTVPNLFEVEAHPTVWQMTSTIHAQSQTGLRLYQLLQALFPCGSVTGAPKRRSLEIIHELEQHPRRLYCGALGWIDPPVQTSDSNSSSKVERDGERAATRQYDLRSVVPGNQHSGADHHDPLPLHRFTGSDVPVGQYGEGASGVSDSRAVRRCSRSGMQARPWTRSAHSEAENRVSEEANVSEANVKQSGRNYKVIRMKWNSNEPFGDFCFSVPIRTLLLDEHGKGELGIGAGITYASSAAQEYAECQTKAKFLTQLLPEFSLFETFALNAAGYIRLPQHLQRLQNSAKTFGFVYCEEKIYAALAQYKTQFIFAKDVPDSSSAIYRIRLCLTPQGEISLSSAPLAPIITPVKLTWASQICASHDQDLRKIALARRTDADSTTCEASCQGTSTAEQVIRRACTMPFPWHSRSGAPVRQGELSRGFEQHAASLRNGLRVQAQTHPARTTQPGRFCVSSNDILLRHKTTYRAVYDEAWQTAQALGYFDALLCNERGEVTEGGRSNIFVKINQQWFTPAIDCGLLPGVMRAELIRQLQAQEAVLYPSDVINAQEWCVCNSLRGALVASLPTADLCKA